MPSLKSVSVAFVIFATSAYAIEPWPQADIGMHSVYEYGSSWEPESFHYAEPFHEHVPLHQHVSDFAPGCIDGSSHGLWGGSIFGIGLPRLNLWQAPEVILTVDVGCESQAGASWSLSSLDRPADYTRIPLGEMTVEMRIPRPPTQDVEIGQNEFFELLLDGKSIATEKCDEINTIIRNIPCPASGRHALQARYRRDNLWSQVSPPLLFEVVLPATPKIVAISDFHHDPVPLQRNRMPEITTPSAKIRLAGVDKQDKIIVFLDGKPLPTQFSDKACCRVIPLKGHISAGVHTLTVHKTGCAGSCGLTSKPSDEVQFHYYEECVYLLKPYRLPVKFTGFLNATPSSKERPPEPIEAGESAPSENSGNAKPSHEIPPPSNHGYFRSGYIRNEGGHGTSPAIALVAFNTAATEPDGLSKQATDIYNSAKPIAKQSKASAAAADQNAAKAEQALARVRSERAAAHKSRDDAHRSLVEAHQHGSKVTNAAIKGALADVGAAYKEANQAANDASSAESRADQHAVAARAEAAAAAHSHDLAKAELEKARVATLQAERFQLAYKAHVANGNGAGAAAALRNLYGALGDVRSAVNSAAKHRDDAKSHNAVAEKQRQFAEAELTNATREKKAAQAAAIKAHNRLTQAYAYHHALDSVDKARAAAERAAVLAAEARQNAKAAAGLVAAAEYYKSAAGTAAQQTKKEKEAALKDLARAKLEAARAAKAAHDANRSANLARAHGKSPHAEQATEYANEAKAHLAKTKQHLKTASTAYNKSALQTSEAEKTASDAASSAQEVNKNATAAVRNAELAEESYKAAKKAQQKARSAANAALNAVQKNHMANANKAELEASSASVRAAVARDDATRYDTATRRNLDNATKHLDLARAASKRATSARESAKAARDSVHKAADDTTEPANQAEEAAKKAGHIQRLKDELAKSIRNAMVKELENILNNRKAVVEKSSNEPTELRVAKNAVNEAGAKANEEEELANARLELAKAEERIHRARAIVGPPSPFIFAAPAHFPIREFDINGRMYERKGATIYEDMTLTFDREGNYRVSFRIEIPPMRTVLRLQLLLQCHAGGPWHTITLNPIELEPKYEESDPTMDREERVLFTIYPIVREGHSEILQRYYGEFGAGGTIRRQGTARFGYGVKVP